MDNESRRSSEQCRQQVQGREFRECQRLLQQRRSGAYNAEEDKEEYLQECCQQLKEMDRQQCGCEAIRQAVRAAQQGGRSYQTGQSEQIYQRARDLPRRCGLSEQQCRFQVVFL
ncbi:hypothetical protein C2S51_013290 [Perilla frutescens var. frutescens]|nr:hypothetical protein C2S51_013290 [Perilla frutescens var. frutescens]